MAMQPGRNEPGSVGVINRAKNAFDSTFGAGYVGGESTMSSSAPSSANASPSMPYSTITSTASTTSTTRAGELSQPSSSLGTTSTSTSRSPVLASRSMGDKASAVLGSDSAYQTPPQGSSLSNSPALSHSSIRDNERQKHRDDILTTPATASGLTDSATGSIIDRSHVLKPSDIAHTTHGVHPTTTTTTSTSSTSTTAGDTGLRDRTGRTAYPSSSSSSTTIGDTDLRDRAGRPAYPSSSTAASTSSTTAGSTLAPDATQPTLGEKIKAAFKGTSAEEERQKDVQKDLAHDRSSYDRSGRRVDDNVHVHSTQGSTSSTSMGTTTSNNARTTEYDNTSQPSIGDKIKAAFIPGKNAQQVHEENRAKDLNQQGGMMNQQQGGMMNQQQGGMNESEWATGYGGGSGYDNTRGGRYNDRYDTTAQPSAGDKIKAAFSTKTAEQIHQENRARDMQKGRGARDYDDDAAITGDGLNALAYDKSGNRIDRKNMSASRGPEDYQGYREANRTGGDWTGDRPTASDKIQAAFSTKTAEEIHQQKLREREGDRPQDTSNLAVAGDNRMNWNDRYNNRNVDNSSGYRQPSNQRQLAEGAASAAAYRNQRRMDLDYGGNNYNNNYNNNRPSTNAVTTSLHTRENRPIPNDRQPRTIFGGTSAEALADGVNTADQFDSGYGGPNRGWGFGDRSGVAPNAFAVNRIGQETNIGGPQNSWSRQDIQERERGRDRNRDSGRDRDRDDYDSNRFQHGSYETTSSRYGEPMYNRYAANEVRSSSYPPSSYPALYPQTASYARQHHYPYPDQSSYYGSGPSSSAASSYYPQHDRDRYMASADQSAAGGRTPHTWRQRERPHLARFVNTRDVFRPQGGGWRRWTDDDDSGRTSQSYNMARSRDATHPRHATIYGSSYNDRNRGMYYDNDQPMSGKQQHFDHQMAKEREGFRGNDYYAKPPLERQHEVLSSHGHTHNYNPIARFVSHVDRQPSSSQRYGGYGSGLHDSYIGEQEGRDRDWARDTRTWMGDRGYAGDLRGMDRDYDRQAPSEIDKSSIFDRDMDTTHSIVPAHLRRSPSPSREEHQFRYQQPAPWRRGGDMDQDRYETERDSRQPFTRGMGNFYGVEGAHQGAHPIRDEFNQWRQTHDNPQWRDQANYYNTSQNLGGRGRREDVRDVRDNEDVPVVHFHDDGNQRNSLNRILSEGDQGAYRNFPASSYGYRDRDYSQSSNLRPEDRAYYDRIQNRDNNLRDNSRDNWGRDRDSNYDNTDDRTNRPTMGETIKAAFIPGKTAQDVHQENMMRRGNQDRDTNDGGQGFHERSNSGYTAGYTGAGPQQQRNNNWDRDTNRDNSTGSTFSRDNRPVDRQDTDPSGRPTAGEKFKAAFIPGKDAQDVHADNVRDREMRGDQRTGSTSTGTTGTTGSGWGTRSWNDNADNNTTTGNRSTMLDRDNRPTDYQDRDAYGRPTVGEKIKAAFIPGKTAQDVHMENTSRQQQDPAQLNRMGSTTGGMMTTGTPQKTSTTSTTTTTTSAAPAAGASGAFEPARKYSTASSRASSSPRSTNNQATTASGVPITQSDRTAATLVGTTPEHEADRAARMAGGTQPQGSSSFGQRLRESLGEIKHKMTTHMSPQQGYRRASDPYNDQYNQSNNPGYGQQQDYYGQQQQGQGSGYYGQQPRQQQFTRQSTTYQTSQQM